MFLNVLQDAEKMPFLNLANLIIKADNEVTQKELGLLNAMKIELQILEFKSKKIEFNKLCESITNRQSQIAIVIELIGLAYSDGEIAQPEMDLILKVANQFNISIEQIDEYKNWVMKMLDLTNQGYCFFDEN